MKKEITVSEIEEHKKTACDMIDKILKRLEDKTGLACESIELYYIDEETNIMSTDILLSVKHLRELNK